MKKGKKLYFGKAKDIYSIIDENSPDKVIIHFRDDTTAFDGKKCASLEEKGKVNNAINAFFMQHLSKNNIKTHFIRKISSNDSLMHKLKMIPIECVVRNILAGSIVKRLGVKSGQELSEPIFEFFLKNDNLHDPIINESHIKHFNFCSEEDINNIKDITLKINKILKPLFKKNNLLLVDYKLEFGIDVNNNILLGDEFTPDSCRLWDSYSKKTLDKDRFRKDMGDVVSSYKIVAKRLGISI